MFGSNKHTTTTTGSTSSSGGFLSRLRSSNPSSTAKKPVYTTGSSRTGIGKRSKKNVGTTTGLGTTNNKNKASLSQKIHGAATVASGKMHNNHREVRAGEKEMEGKNPNSGLFNHGTTHGTSRNTRI